MEFHYRAVAQKLLFERVHLWFVVSRVYFLVDSIGYVE